MLTPTRTFIPNSVGNSGGLFVGLPRTARAAVIDKVYPFGEAPSALAHLLGHQARGKAVIAV